ncbi:MAG: GNAT family N-acetyltransferase [Spirochaetaceae bacterium]|nr:GNAT family N-acetyltransferase [Spirochaetaceae bacterium]
MEIIDYKNEYFIDVFDVVHKTIGEIYPKYYPAQAVEFFHNHHSLENMRKKLPNEYTKIILEDGKIIGTGSVDKNEINRFFVLPNFQNKGYGKIILKELENTIKKNNYKKITLASSLGAVFFYRKCGYEYYDYKIISVEEGQYLCYLEMEKEID